MIKNGVNAPQVTSCGRLFDAVAAALDICRERQGYEGEAAARLEALVDLETLRDEDDTLGYPLSIPNLRGSGMPYVEPLAMWQAILGDLILKTPAPVMAARFHKGLAKVDRRHGEETGEWRGRRRAARFTTVVLSGGCFQNRILFEEVTRRLEGEDFIVLSHARVPANDGGLALGQAAIGAAHLIDAENSQIKKPGRKRAMCLGIPGRIVKIDDVTRKLATVDVGGVKRQINIACIVNDKHPVASCVGDWVLVHVGFAMSRINEEEAALTLQILTELGEAQTEIEAMRLSAAE